MAQFNSGEWMEASAPMAKEHPGFESPRIKKRVSTPSAPNKLTSRFAALDMETEEEEPVKHIEPRNLGPTWAQVAKGVAKTEEDEDEDEDEDEELPPLNWGQRPMARWGDVSA